MIRKTAKVFKRRALSWESGYLTNESHVETVYRETWWLFGIIPLYSHDALLRHSL